MNNASFAVRIVKRCINAARKANHASLKARANGRHDDSAVLREIARMNIRQAKRSKSHARMVGMWDIQA